MQTRSKFLAFFLLASAAVMGCADEPADEGVGSPTEAVVARDKAAQESTETSLAEAAGDTDKGLKDDYCCVLKAWACDVNTWSDECLDGNPQITVDCIDTRRTKLGAKSFCAVQASGSFITGHALRDNFCRNYGDCQSAWLLY